MSTKAKKPTILTLHQLLPAFSYWGAATRVLLIAFLALIVFLIRVSELESNGQMLGQAILVAGQGLLYAVGSFLILEVAYLIIARAYTIRRAYDKTILLGSVTILALSYFLPYFVLIPGWFVMASRFLLVAVLLILGLRLLIGLLYGHKRTS